MQEIFQYLPEDFQDQIRKGNLMISISGIRAKLPEGMTLSMLEKLIESFILVSGEKIVIGNDGRGSSLILQSFIESLLFYYGKKVIVTGIAPTPTIKATCELAKADGGIIITASHNPSEWNGLKFLKKRGFFYEKEDIVELLKNLNAPDKKPEPKTPLFDDRIPFDGIEAHINAILKQIPAIPQIRKKKYRVVVDAVNGSGIRAIPLLLEKLGCEVIMLNQERKKLFQRPPEPTPKALAKFSSFLKKSGAAAGFALDPDGDRLVCGSPLRGAINEEYTLPLAYLGKKNLLKKNYKFVINYSTSKILERVVSNDGHAVIRTAVGEANVVKKMMAIKSPFGGEGNGGVIDLSIPSYGRDSLTGIAYILSAMAERNAKTIDDLIEPMPHIHMEKLKFSYKFDEKETLLRGLKEKAGNFPGKQIRNFSEEDGYFFEFNDSSWIHIRFSNTEPVVRIIFEAGTKKELSSMKDYISTFLPVKN